MKSALALIAINARKHYNQRAAVPCWNPSRAAFYVLRLVAGLPRFLVPTLRTWAAIDRASKRSASTQYKGITLHSRSAYALPGIDYTAAPRYMVAH